MALHESVLLNEVLQYLDLAPGKTIVDGTLGAGGHAKAILQRTAPNGKLIGLDKDPDALALAKEALVEFGDRAKVLSGDFRDLAQKLKEVGIGKVQGVFLDLGVSSMQLDRPERGFSFKADGPLDMRMDTKGDVTAADLVNRCPKETLEKILWEFGEERYSRRIVERILKSRQIRKIETTAQLAEIIREAVPTSYRYQKIHPATRSFQGLRIVVNRELEALEQFLQTVLSVLDVGGRVVILSFHSLEDRLVKNYFRNFMKEGLGVVLTKKLVRAEDFEVERNPRARSAGLRAFQKA